MAEAAQQGTLVEPVKRLHDTLHVAEDEQLDSHGRRGLGAAMLRVAKSRWLKVKGAVDALKRAKALAQEGSASFLAASQEALAKAESGQAQVQLQVAKLRDLDKINYIQQGNRDLYTEEALQQRHLIRSAPAFVESVRAWWRYLPKAGEAGSAETDVGSTQTPRSASAVISQPVYCAMTVALQMVLLPRFGMQGDPDYDPSEDWRSDCKGQQGLDYPNLLGALFELADMWCETVDANDYASLLTQLLADVQQQDQDSGLFQRLLERFGHHPGGSSGTSDQSRRVGADMSAGEHGGGRSGGGAAVGDEWQQGSGHHGCAGLEDEAGDLGDGRSAVRGQGEVQQDTDAGLSGERQGLAEPGVGLSEACGAARVEAAGEDAGVDDAGDSGAKGGEHKRREGPLRRREHAGQPRRPSARDVRGRGQRGASGAAGGVEKGATGRGLGVAGMTARRGADKQRPAQGDGGGGPGNGEGGAANGGGGRGRGLRLPPMQGEASSASLSSVPSKRPSAIGASHSEQHLGSPALGDAGSHTLQATARRTLKVSHSDIRVPQRLPAPAIGEGAPVGERSKGDVWYDRYMTAVVSKYSGQGSTCVPALQQSVRGALTDMLQAQASSLPAAPWEARAKKATQGGDRATTGVAGDRLEGGDSRAVAGDKILRGDKAAVGTSAGLTFGAYVDWRHGRQADAGTATPDHCGAQPMLATPLAQQQQQQEQRLQQRHQQQQQPQLSPLGHDTRPPSPETPPELRSQSSFNSNDGEFDYHAYSLHQLSTLSRPAAGAPAALAADKSVDPRWHRNPIQLYEARLRREQRQQARQELKQLRHLRVQETEAMYERHRQRAVWSTAFPPGPAECQGTQRLSKQEPPAVNTVATLRLPTWTGSDGGKGGDGGAAGDGALRPPIRISNADDLPQICASKAARRRVEVPFSFSAPSRVQGGCGLVLPNISHNAAW